MGNGQPRARQLPVLTHDLTVLTGVYRPPAVSSLKTDHKSGRPKGAAGWCPDIIRQPREPRVGRGRLVNCLTMCRTAS